jgi:hypothetical protein
MSSRPLLSEGPQAEEVVRLRRELAGLEQELAGAKAEAQTIKAAAADSVHAIRALRKQLEPLYASLKLLFGEISRVDAGKISGPDSPTIVVSGLSPKWQMLKEKLGGRQAEFIELLQHGQMTVAQLRAAAHCDIRTAYKTIEKMKAGGLLVNNGGKFALKEL